MFESKGVREFDIIVFGATGFTGEYVVEELARVTNSNSRFTKSWAIAGRNEINLKSVLQRTQDIIKGIELLSVPIIVADVKDKQSIQDMCKRAKLILNCVGPYKHFGEVVVAACIENGTHHVDLSGEIHYLETTQAKYFEDARKKGVYIVQSCGFDSIPADLGVAMLEKKFPGDLNTVRSYVEFFYGPEGHQTNIGTWVSAVHSVTDVLMSFYYTGLMKKVFNKPLPNSSFPMPRSFPISHFYCSEEVKGWCIWFPGPDERVVKRSQMFAYQFENKRPVDFTTFLKTKSFFSALCYLFYSIIFGILAMTPPGRNLLAKYPSFFTNGMFNKDGPSRKQVKSCSTRFTLYGEGWGEKLAEPTDQHTVKPDIKKILTVTGPEPAYDFTSKCMVHAGLVILDESDNMPLTGGVLTPGVAFVNTTLVSRLGERGVIFSCE